MSGGLDPEETTTVPPDEAFAALGNETRIRILQVLGDADELVEMIPEVRGIVVLDAIE